MPATIPLLDLTRQHHRIKDEVESAVARVFESQRFILGPEVEAFENECAEVLGAHYAVGVASGTDGLLLSYKGLELTPGDEVLTSPFSFFATAGAVINSGARPVFADIDPGTFNLDPDAVADAISGRTRVVCAVHLFGQAAESLPYEPTLQQKGIALVEDACQSIGALDGERRVGSIGATGSFSFFPSKNLGGAGDGGLITVGDAGLAERIRSLRHHGQTGTYQHAWVGTNSRLDALQAAILRVKLRHLHEWNDGRRANAAGLAERFRSSRLQIREGGHLDGADISLPAERPGCRHVFNQYTVRARDRDGLRAHLGKEGVGCSVYYPLPLHLQPCFESLGYRTGAFPESEAASKEVISLPVFPELTGDELDRVVAAVESYYF